MRRLALIGGIAALLPLLAYGLGSLDWRLELFSHFLPHASVLLALVACVVGKGRARQGFALAGCLGFMATIQPLLPSSAKPAGQGGAIRLLSYNVYLHNPDMVDVQMQIARHDPDLILLIELTPAQWQQLHALRKRYPHGCAHPQDDPFGMAVLSRLPLRSCVVEGEDLGLPVIVARLERGPYLVGLHAPPPLSPLLASQRQAMLGHWSRRLADQPDALLMGDLNLTPWSPIYRQLLSNSGLRDARAGQGMLASWPASLGVLGLPLDQAMVGRAWAVADLQVGSAGMSDHRPLILTVAPRAQDAP
ncbi:endonuclease/exonuclease/phosphatase family protein [Chitinimonas viridis]|uniref:Endonuclease/exonuclease/phosphatase family protein n=1 Tax=Chitinimonas viridis TaxID=664880 RepID=A0ABT8BB76_9NEIS|nr:endonuclease/exonuclease/phosphatase family protein [Chitinimonas viridis]MDN3578818.1 endonuclease/exonuclease/phosphatase family protein [Chitinimonas viridis]